MKYGGGLELPRVAQPHTDVIWLVLWNIWIMTFHLLGIIWNHNPN